MGDPGLDDRLGTISKSVAGIGDAGARAAERMAASFDTATLTMSASLKRMVPTLADAILDRVIHNAYRIELAGESLRKRRSSP